MALFPLLIVFFLFPLLIYGDTKYQHKIYVSSNGTNSTSCWKLGQTPCVSINLALQGLQNSTAVYIYPGTYIIEPGSETNLRGLFHVGIVGLGNQDDVIISCHPLTRVSFTMSDDITIESLTFLGCTFVTKDTPNINLSYHCGLMFSDRNIFHPNVSDCKCDDLDNRNKTLIDKQAKTDNVNPKIPPGGKLPLQGIEYGYINDNELPVVSIINGSAHFDNSKYIASVSSDYYYYNNTDVYYIVVYCSNADDIGDCFGVDITFSTEVINRSGPMGTPTYHNFTFTECPPLWEFRKEPGKCKLKAQVEDKVLCMNDNHYLYSESECQVDSYVFPMQGYCVSKNNKSDTIIGSCPVSYTYPAYEYSYMCDVPVSKCIDNKYFCSSKRSGRLCGACVKDNGIPINSLYLECIDCTHQSHHTPVPGWVLFIILQMIPLTIMIILIIVLNVKLTIGSANGFLFYNQIMSLVFPSGGYPAWILSTINIEFYIFSFLQFLLLPYTIWNLDFISSFGSFLPICITPHMTAVEVISFWYLIASYPLVLLLLLYVWLIMYEKGFRCVVYITRPIHRLLARFWRIFDIEPSFTDSIASIYVLCFTQFTVTCVKLLQFSKWESINNSDTGFAFYYDGTLDYFHGYHVFYGIMAIIIFILVVLLPTLYLVLYPFKWFHRLLDLCKLRREGVCDVFTGPYKHGADNTADCRMFSSFYFILRFVIILSFAFEMHPNETFIGHSFQLAISILTAGIIMIFRPYKRNIHNFVEFTIFLLLATMAVNNVVLKGPNETYVSINYFFIMHLPFLFAFGFFLYWISKKMKSCCRYCRRNRHNAILRNDDIQQENEIQPFISDDDFVFADRINNPNDYDEHHERNVPYDPIPCTARTQTNGTSSTVNATYGSIITSRISTGTI